MNLAELLARPDWFKDAACRGVDPEFFFPERGGAWAHIKAVCDTCPVATQCLEYGLWERDGVWGGKSGKERRAIRRGRPQPTRPPAKCGSEAAYRRHVSDGEQPCVRCIEARAAARSERRQRSREAA
jgi:WhiB family redox-sensing transcriptional regulator